MIKRQKRINKTFVTIPSVNASLKLSPNRFCKKVMSIIAIVHQVTLKRILNLTIDNGEPIMKKKYAKWFWFYKYQASCNR